MMMRRPYRQAARGALAAWLVLVGVPICAAQTPAPQGPLPSTPPAGGNIDRAKPAPDKPANRLSEIAPMLTRCLQLPPDDVARPGMRITVRLSFTRDGAILGEPRFTFTTPGVSTEVKVAYQRAVVDMLNRCTPLAITKELGGAIAGRPFVFAIVDSRNQRKAEASRAAVS
jgi:hypothetical protein